MVITPSFLARVRKRTRTGSDGWSRTKLETPVTSKGDGNSDQIQFQVAHLGKTPHSPREGTEINHDYPVKFWPIGKTPILLERGRKRRSSTDKLYIIQLRTPIRLARVRNPHSGILSENHIIVRTLSHLGRGRKRDSR